MRFKKEDDPKSEERQWVMAMESEDMVREWGRVFDEYINRSRKTTLERDSKEPRDLFSPDMLKNRLIDAFPQNVGTPSPGSTARNDMVAIPES